MKRSSLSTSALVSVVLHGALVAALLHIRYEPGGEPGAFNVIQVEWVRSGVGIARDGAAEDGSSVPAPPANEMPPPEAAPAVEPARIEEAVPAPAAAESAPSAAARDDEPQPRAARATEPEPPAPEPAAAPPPAPLISASVAPEPPSPTLPQPLPGRAEAPRPAPATTPAVTVAVRPSDPAPVSEPIPERQREMLDRRIERWTRDFEAVALEGPDVSWEHEGQAYTATFTEMPATDAMGIDRVRVQIRTARSGQALATEMELQRLSFSHFAQFVDRWDPEVQVHDDEIDGRFHSNSEISISSSRGVAPTFHGKVTTARGIDTSYSTSRVRRAEVFRGGLETRVGRISLPARFVPFEAEDGARVTTFGVDTHIVFHADGTFGFRPVDGPAAAEERRPLGEEPAYLLATDKAELHVSGVVNGKVLVHSPRKIVIVDDLTYAADPRRPGADDYVGLVSDGAIEVAEPEVTGPGDLTIHAAVFAKRRFQVRSYRSRGPATLTLFGSLTAGSLSATEPRFRTRLEFDRRLENARPPRFPVTARYELTEWDGEWTLAEPDEPAARFADAEEP